MEHHLPYEITQCYLLPDTGEHAPKFSVFLTSIFVLLFQYAMIRCDLFHKLLFDIVKRILCCICE